MSLRFPDNWRIKAWAPSEDDDPALLSELRRVEIAVDGSTADIEVWLDGSLLLAQTMVASGGKITLYDVDRLLEPYFDAGDPVRLLGISVDGSSPVSDMPVVYCAVAVRGTGGDWLRRHFLSGVAERRTTSAGRREKLHYFPFSGEAAPYADCRYYDTETGQVATRRVQLAAVEESAFISSVDASPSRFEDSSVGVLMGYEVVAGERRQEYRIEEAVFTPIAVEVYNRFGVPEMLYLGGAPSYEPKYTFNQAECAGDIVPYGATGEALVKLSTGPMAAWMEPLARDLARAGWCRVDGVAMVVTDVDGKSSMASDALNELTFTLRRAAEPGVEMREAGAERIFDETFDETYV